MTESTAPRHRMRWWGWGVDGHDKPLTDSAADLLRREIGMRDENHPPIDIGDVQIPAARLGDDDLAALRAAAPAVADDHDTRVRHAVGRSYPDLARLRAGKLEIAPDAVVTPADEDELAAVLRVCSDRGIAVVPFGGGTSVVGGVEAVDGGFGKAIALSMTRFDRVLDVDRVAGTVTVETGVYGPDLEAHLAPTGMTVGHFPQSFEFSTVGGWLACRSAGQESSGYGRIDRNVIGLRVVTPAGAMEFRDIPSTAAGPDPRQLFLGSEGTLGVIVHATLQLHRAPKEMIFDTYFFRSFEEGAEVFRELEQSGEIPHLARLSDEKETLYGIEQLSGSIGSKLTGYLRARGYETPCMAIFGFGQESPAAGRVARERLAARLLRRPCTRLGAIPGMMWVKARFTSPYLRDVMMTRGVAVDTLETATTWDNAAALRRAIVEGMEAAADAHGTPAYVFCHISHMYESGCSLYFTYFFREERGRIMDQWMDIKGAASDAIVAHGGTITHHHGVGQDHAPWNRTENTELYGRVLAAVKRELDPAGVLNPGKLFTGPADLRDRYRGDEV